MKQWKRINIILAVLLVICAVWYWIVIQNKPNNHIDTAVLVISLSSLVLVLVSLFFSTILYQLWWNIAVNVLPERSVHIARPWRNLTAYEKEYIKHRMADILADEHDKIGSVKGFGIVLISLIVIFICQIVFSRFVDDYDSAWGGLVFAITIIVGSIASLFNRRDIPLEKDLHSPVLMLQDTFYESFGKAQRSYDFRVGKYEFLTERIYVNKRHLISDFHNGNKVMIEFSPNTNIIWSIELMK